MQCPVCSAENADSATQCATCGVTQVPADDPSVLPPGTSLYHGAYAVGQCVGHGGFGITYRATDLKLRRMVAIKEFFPSGCVRQGTTVRPSGGWTAESYQDGRGRFLLEGEALARFDHPGIVRVHAAFEENDTVYIVMEFLQGKNLEQISRERGGRLPVTETLACATKLGAALEVVHGAGLLHRDIKPGNVMVVGGDSLLADPRIVLVDFGAAREYVAGVSKTHSTALTPGYAPLEQYSRRAVRGPYTDLYAMAALLYHALTGIPPPDAHDRHFGETLHDVRAVNPEVGEAVGKAIMRGLEMEVGKRPQTVREFLGELGGSLASPAHGPTQVPTPMVRGPAPPPTPPAGTSNASSGQPHAGSPVSPPPQAVLAGPSGGGSVPAAGIGGASLGPGMAGGRVPGARPRTEPAWGWAIAIAPVVMVLGILGLWWAASGNPPGGSSSLKSSGTNAKGFQEFTNEKDGTVLVKIPGGTFQMGSNEQDDEKPPHSVTLPAYLMARVPVTNAQFARFVSATGHDAGNEWKLYASNWGDQAPVVCVSWNDATAYCAWAGLRLPTEAEWEYAARGPQSLVYPWGNDWDPSRCQNSVGSNSPGRAAPVGSFPSGVSPFGCLDMAGNAWQWTSSWYDRYPGNTTSDDAFGQKYRVLRGASWDNNFPSIFRGAYRIRYIPVVRYNDFGFRCARSAP